MSYGYNFRQRGRPIGHVYRSHRAAKPGQLPIQQIARVEPVVNLRIAKELGITIPWSLLLRADEVIE